MTRLTITFLVLLRLAIGWHLFYEGWKKVQKGTFTSEDYLRESVGPLAPVFRGMAGDPLADRLTPLPAPGGEDPTKADEYKLFPPELAREWDAWFDRFASHYELTDEQRDFVEATRSSADALLTIINDILDFSKIESGKLELENHPFELHTCIEEALDLLASKAAEKKLDLCYLVDDSIPKVLVSDVTRLRQILVNLIGNAVKFTNSGEVVIEVAPSARASTSLAPPAANGEINRIGRVG